jgi:hypothetical protein
MAAPTVTATPDKSSYNVGDVVKIQFAVVDGPVNSGQSRTITWTGQDGEGNVISGSLTTTVNSPVPDTFQLTSVKWPNGTAFSINGLLATGIAPGNS